MKTKICIFCIAGILLLCLSAHAAPGGGERWESQFSLYSWLAGQKGSVATLPGLPPTDIDIDFYDDIIGNINAAMFLNFEMRKGRWGVLADIAYTDIEDEDATPYELLWQAVTSQTKSWIVSAAGQYRLVDETRSSMDVFGGIRYWSVDSRLSLTGGPAQDRKPSNKEDWFDPILGLKGMNFLGASDFFVSGGMAFGGFGMGSDFIWDAWANLGYQWTETFGVSLGYRYMDVDYEKGDFLYDVAQQGLLLGLGWQF
jgi:hypothetical protein